MKIAVIPDLQIRPGDNLQFLNDIATYIIDKRPDVIVQIGDLADMPSLSSYDYGKKSFEGRRYKDDIDSAVNAQKALFGPIFDLQEQQRKNGKKQYKPRTLITIGNHENRINRAVENDAKLEGVLSIDDLQFDRYFDEVYPFLDVVVVGGVAFSHYFTTGVAGRPASSAQAQLNKNHMSCIAGHQQGYKVATGNRADGKSVTSIIAGSCYEHDEDYLGPQGNHHARGIIMLHDVEDGEFEHNFVTLKYLRERRV